MDKQDKFQPPTLSYDPRAVFTDELTKVLPAVTASKAAMEAAWQRFISFSRMAYSEEPEQPPVAMREDQFRRAAWCWVERERAVKAQNQAKTDFDDATSVFDSLVGELRTANRTRGKCMMPDLEHGCVRQHDCDAEHDTDNDSNSANPGELLSRLFESVLGGAGKILELKVPRNPANPRGKKDDGGKSN